MSETGIDRMAAYREAGVDLDLSNIASQIAIGWAQKTWGNRDGGYGTPSSIDSNFTSAKSLLFDEIRQRPDVIGCVGSDGVGTKPDFYERMGEFRGLGSDLVAMAADDLPIEGGRATYMTNTLIVNKLTEEYIPYIDQLFQGLAEAANEAGLVIFTGEVAVHGDRMKGPADFTLDWAGTAEGLKLPEREITGAKIK